MIDLNYFFEDDYFFSIKVMSKLESGEPRMKIAGKSKVLIIVNMFFFL